MFKQASSSPIKFKQSTNHSSNANRTLDEEREAMVSDLQEIVPEVKLSFFEKHILPPSPLPDKASLKSVVDLLLEQRKINKLNKWMNWQQPSKSTAKGDDVFEKFKSLAKDILVVAAAATQIDKAVGIEFKCNPHTKLESSTRNNSSKPDCYGILPRAHDRDNVSESWLPKWLDVATPGEFKKKNTERNFVDDAKKVLWSMNHIMREDARRSSVIGFTIEDSSMRLWFCSRSDVFMSEAFDMLTDHETFVDFILRMSYATEQQLGWDPSITLREESLLRPGGLQYDIQVVERDESKEKKVISARTFRTQKIISNFAADALRGRATRVWEVKELDERGEEIGASCVLKDSWVYCARLSEGLILAKIRKEAVIRRWRKQAAKDAAMKAAAKAAMRAGLTEVSTKASAEVSPESPEEVSEGRGAAQDLGGAGVAAGQGTEESPDDSVLEDYLLTVVTHGTVWIDGTEVKSQGWTIQPDHIRVVPVKVKMETKPSTTAQSSLKPVGSTAIETETNEVDSDSESTKSHVAFANKTHNRIVFREVCQPILAVNSLSKVFEYLATIASALKSLHELGWVHRDISSGNILIYKGSPKLTDLEYAKHEDDWAACGVRTGTPYFMAVEVEETGYSSLTAPPILTPDWVAEANPAILTSWDNDPVLADRPRITFRNNPLHDKESLLWLALYFVMSARLVAMGTTAESILDKHTKIHRDLAVKLFEDHTVRYGIVNSKAGLLQSPTMTRAKVSFAPIRGVLGILHMLFQQLREVYEAAEDQSLLPIPFTVANGLHARFAQVFRGISERFLHDDITIAMDQDSYTRLRALYRSTSKPLSDASPVIGKKSRGDDGNIKDTAGPGGLRPLKKRRTGEASDTLPKTTSASHGHSKLRD